jgi:protease II
VALLVELNKQRQLKCISHKANKLSVHYFDSEFELNPQTKQLSDFFDVSLEDNFNFDNHEVRYKFKTPYTAEKILSYNMATKRTSFIQQT